MHIYLLRRPPCSERLIRLWDGHFCSVALFPRNSDACPTSRSTTPTTAATTTTTTRSAHTPAAHVPPRSTGPPRNRTTDEPVSRAARPRGLTCHIRSRHVYGLAGSIFSRIRAARRVDGHPECRGTAHVLAAHEDAPDDSAERATAISPLTSSPGLWSTACCRRDRTGKTRACGSAGVHASAELGRGCIGEAIPRVCAPSSEDAEPSRIRTCSGCPDEFRMGAPSTRSMR